MTAMDRPLRWGIAATGAIAASMAETLTALPDAEVVAVGSRTRASAAAFASRFAIDRAHGSYEALFADDGVDIVYVASPHHLHRDMTVAALDAGKHVVCEKAFALNRRQAVEMVDAAHRNDRFLMEAMWTWFIPAVIEAKRRIDNGDIGDLKLIEANFGIRVDDLDGRHRRIDLGGGALLDLGLYPVSFASYFAGPVRDCKVLGVLADTGVDTTVGGVVSFDRDVIGVFHTTLEALTGLGASIIGTDGRIDIAAPFWFPTRFTVRSNDRDPERVEIPHDGLAHEAQHAMDRIRAGHSESDVISLATTVATMTVLDDMRAQLGVVYPEERT